MRNLWRALRFGLLLVAVVWLGQSVWQRYAGQVFDVPLREAHWILEQTGLPPEVLGSEDHDFEVQANDPAKIVWIVKEDGKERPIVSFAAFADADPSSTPPAASGTARPGPATVLLIDDGHLTAEQTLRLRPDLKGLLAKVGARSGTLSLVAPQSRVSEGRTLPFGATELTAAVDLHRGELLSGFAVIRIVTRGI
jgi:hypothetical protein